MCRCLQLSFLFISLLVRSTSLYSQQLFPFPFTDGVLMRYSASIEMEKGYVSGICVLRNIEGRIDGSLFNEFGVTVLDFSYDLHRKKVKLHYVFNMLDKWYIKRVVRKDLAKLLDSLQDGTYEYENTRRNIVYRFTPLQ